MIWILRYEDVGQQNTINTNHCFVHKHRMGSHPGVPRLDADTLAYSSLMQPPWSTLA